MAEIKICPHCRMEIRETDSAVIVEWIDGRPEYHLDCRFTKSCREALDKLIPKYRKQFTDKK